MPCVKAVIDEKNVPARSAHLIVAGMLIANTILSIALILFAGIVWPTALHLFVGPLLAYFLWKQYEKSRIVTSLWALVALFVIPVLLAGPGIDFATGVYVVSMQLCFSVATILLLIWRTVAWRLISGAALATAFSLLTVLSAIGLAVGG